MKKAGSFAIPVLLLGISGFSQLKQGSKMLSVRSGAGKSNGSINMLSISGSLSSFTDNGSILSTEFSYTSIKRRSLLFYAGLGFNSHFIEFTDNAGNKGKGDGLSAYPFAGIQKLVSLRTNKIYYPPSLLAGIAFQHDNINSITGNTTG